MAHIKGPWEGSRATVAARYRDPDGHERSRTFARKVDAQRWLDQVTADLVTGRYVDPRAGRVTLADFAAQWLTSQTFDASTRETMESRVRTHILPTIGDVELRHLKPSTVQTSVRSRQTEVASPYCRLLLSNLSTTVFAPPKGGREREVSLPDVVSVALAEHVRRYGTSEVLLPWREPGGEAVSGKLLFTNRDRGPLTGRTSLITRGSRLCQRPGSSGAGRRGCTHSVTTTPQCSSMAGCPSGRCPSTWATTTPASPCVPTPI